MHPCFSKENDSDKIVPFSAHFFGDYLLLLLPCGQHGWAMRLSSFLLDDFEIGFLILRLPVKSVRGSFATGVIHV